jgi:hypothetical protein
MQSFPTSKKLKAIALYQKNGIPKLTKIESICQIHGHYEAKTTPVIG